MLRNDRDDFGMSQENLPHFSRRRFAVFERERGHGHGGANPEVAFFQMRKKLAAQPRTQKKAAKPRNDNADSDDQSAVRQRKTQRRIVEPVQCADDDRFGFFHVLRQQQRSDHRRDGEGGNQRAGQRVAIGPRHGAEDLALDSLHREERHKAGHGDQR